MATDAIERLIRMANAEAETLMDCHTNADGEWSSPEDEAEYRRECAVIDAARSELAGLRARLSEVEAERDAAARACNGRHREPYTEHLQERLEAAERERDDLQHDLERYMEIASAEANGRLEAEAQRDRLAEALREAEWDVRDALDQLPSLNISSQAKEVRHQLLLTKLNQYRHGG